MIALFVEQGKSPSLREIPDSHRGRVYEREDKRTSLSKLVHPDGHSLGMPLVSYTKFHWRATMVLNNTEIDIFTDTSSIVHVPFLEALNVRERELVLLLKAIVLSQQDDDTNEPLAIPIEFLAKAEQYDLAVTSVKEDQEGLEAIFSGGGPITAGLIITVTKP